MKKAVGIAMVMMLIANNEIFSLAVLSLLSIAGLYYITKKGVV